MIPLGDSRPRHSPRQNFLSIELVKDELIKDLGPVGGSPLGSNSPALSCNPTSGLESNPGLK